MTLVTAAEFERRMKEIADRKPVNASTESGAALIASTHEDADDLMCEVLKSMGYDAGVKIFEGMNKYYA